MKKFFIFLLSCFCVLSLSGCNLWGEEKAIPAEDILSSYMENPQETFQQYRGKNIKITGTVLEKGHSFPTNTPYITLAEKTHPGTGKKYSLIILYDKDQAHEWDAISTDQTISTKSRYSYTSSALFSPDMNIFMYAVPADAPISSTSNFFSKYFSFRLSHWMPDIFPFTLLSTDRHSESFFGKIISFPHFIRDLWPFGKTTVPVENPIITPSPAPKPTPSAAPKAEDQTKLEKKHGPFGPTNAEISLTSSSPTGVFVYFHEQITAHNLKEAFACLSPAFKNQLDYAGWAAGYDTTLKSDPQIMGNPTINENEARIPFVLHATDRKGDSTIQQTFSGTATLHKLDGVWKIDEIVAKKIS